MAPTTPFERRLSPPTKTPTRAGASRNTRGTLLLPPSGSPSATPSRRTTRSGSSPTSPWTSSRVLVAGPPTPSTTLSFTAPSVARPGLPSPAPLHIGMLTFAASHGASLPPMNSSPAGRRTSWRTSTLATPASNPLPTSTSPLTRVDCRCR